MKNRPSQKRPGWYFLNADTPTLCVRIRQAKKEDWFDLQDALTRESAKRKPRQRLVKRLIARIDELT